MSNKEKKTYLRFFVARFVGNDKWAKNKNILKHATKSINLYIDLIHIKKESIKTILPNNISAIAET